MSDLPMTIGMDVGRGDQSAIWLTSGGGMLGFRTGDRIHIFGRSNRHRFLVEHVISDSQLTVAEFIRPSRGYARHIRRMKARRGSK